MTSRNAQATARPTAERSLFHLARPTLVRLGLAAALVGPFGGPGVAAQPAAPPAPLPVLPDLRVLPPSSLYIVAASDTSERRLKFTTTIWNAGPGLLEVRGAEDPATGELTVRQVLYSADGREVPGDAVGTFDFEHRHGHLHLSGFARYELWTVAPDGALVELVAVNEKVGFCLMDNVLLDRELAVSAEPRYPIDCEGDVQGISPGYGDVYAAQLYEQDVVVTGLPDGRYALVNVANPEGVISEATLENNRSVVYLVLEGDSVRVVDAP